MYWLKLNYPVNGFDPLVLLSMQSALERGKKKPEKMKSNSYLALDFTFEGIKLVSQWN